MMRGQLKYFMVFVLAVSLLFSVIGCGNGADTVDETGEEGEETLPEESGEKIFIIARGTDAKTLDCGYSYHEGEIDLAYHFYDGLVKFKDETLEIEPALALDWSGSEDGLVWTFNLREGVKFHDGTDFNAEAVEFSFMRILDESHPYYGLGDQGLAYMDWLLGDAIKEVRAVDDYVVEIELNDVFGPFMTYMAIYSQYIVSPTAVAEYGEDYFKNPVGTGPFKFVEWKRDEYVTMAAFEDYWGEKPEIDTLIWKVVPDESTRLMELQSGNVHAIKSISPAQLETIQNDANLKLLQVAGSNLFYAAINHKAEPFDDVRVRQAVMHAVDFDSLVDSVYEGLGTRAINPMPPTIFGFNDGIEPYAYDPEKAKELLAEAGYPDGFTMDLHVFAESRSYVGRPVDAAEIFKSDLSQVGIDANVVVNEWGTHRDLVRNYEHSIGFLGWYDVPHPNNFLNLMLLRAVNNQYENEELNELSDKALATFDRSEQEAHYREMQVISHRDVVVVPVAHSDYTAVVLKDINGFELDPLGNVIARRVSF
ncbi:MAG: ABC transporter substrate-binding protein [Bacillota bacterium]